MQPLVRFIIPIVIAMLASGCGNQIGDSCVVDTDCSPDGDRLCVDKQYCSIFGCDYNTCPDEAVCVRFFAAASTGLPCAPATEDVTTDDCTVDEICSLGGNCMVRAAETRYCMLACESGDDCRSGFECRDRELMIRNGGEPVVAPDQKLGDDPQGFCAVEGPQPSSVAAHVESR